MSRQAKSAKVRIVAAPTMDELMRVVDHARAIVDDDPKLSDILYRTAAWYFGPGSKIVWTKAAKDQYRHWAVRYAFDQGAEWSGDDVFAKVSEQLSRLNHPAAAGEEQIRKSYQTVQAALPPEQQRRRTYRRRSPRQ